MVRQAKGKEDSQKGGKALIIICIVLIIALVGVVAYLLMEKRKAAEGNAVNRNVVVNEDNVEEVLQEIEEQEYVAPGYYNVIMNSTWFFSEGDAPSDNAYVENSVSNTNAVYFDVLLADTEEVIYASPILPVGSHLENITLDKALEDGIYDCLIIYHMLDEEEQDTGTLKMTLTIEIGQQTTIGAEKNN